MAEFYVVIPFKSGLFFELKDNVRVLCCDNCEVVIPFKSGLFFEYNFHPIIPNVNGKVVIPFKSGLFFE